MATKPDYILSVMDKTTGAKSGNLGGAWKNASGALSIRLNPGTSLVYNPDLQIMLFPNDREKDYQGEPATFAKVLGEHPRFVPTKKKPKRQEQGVTLPDPIAPPAIPPWKEGDVPF